MTYCFMEIEMRIWIIQPKFPFYVNSQEWAVFCVYVFFIWNCLQYVLSVWPFAFVFLYI